LAAHRRHQSEDPSNRSRTHSAGGAIRPATNHTIIAATHCSSRQPLM
jgi:hypothetical protein